MRASLSKDKLTALKKDISEILSRRHTTYNDAVTIGGRLAQAAKVI